MCSIQPGEDEQFLPRKVGQKDYALLRGTGPMVLLAQGDTTNTSCRTSQPECEDKKTSTVFQSQMVGQQQDPTGNKLIN